MKLSARGDGNHISNAVVTQGVGPRKPIRRFFLWSDMGGPNKWPKIFRGLTDLTIPKNPDPSLE